MIQSTRPSPSLLTWLCPMILTAALASTPPLCMANETKGCASLPFHLVDGFIVLDGEVQGQVGKFIFDTGTPFPVFLNNHVVRMRKDVLVGKGHAASGQALTLYRQKKAPGPVAFAGQVELPSATQAIHTNFAFIETGIVPGFLGFIGHGWNKAYVFTIDYDLQTISIDPQNKVSEQAPCPVRPGHLVAAMPFRSSKEDGRIPEVEMHIGDVPIKAAFDTGNQGTLSLTKETQERLIRAGHLRTENSRAHYGAYENHTQASLTGLRYQGLVLPDQRMIRLTTADHDELGLGYQFLKQFITVWDFQRQIIELRQDVPPKADN